ncbi:hypothetical protein DE4585_04543 [Mycobacteroides salmoniphilum]|uniref:Uncharacterized protein n=1 Tax=Mycobacteroides salmoniphilum TaxID=404941 RepID=A0A4R8RWN3_9MYCO|nr:hypothetical protein [Mycobacteroides salmoniphilum]TDZ78706.1 hypothetical protein DE4585_04543 [Mycobacteroides salmoniphilum]
MTDKKPTEDLSPEDAAALKESELQTRGRGGPGVIDVDDPGTGNHVHSH